MFGKPTTVRVTTKEEFDAAVASNRPAQIVVEGDDDLLTYAAKVAGDEATLQIDQIASGENKIEVEAPQDSTVTASSGIAAGRDLQGDLTVQQQRLRWPMLIALLP